MFLVERRPSSSILADLMPRQLFSGAGDIIRAGLVSRSLPSEPQNAAAGRMPSQLDLAFPETAVRKAG